MRPSEIPDTIVVRADPNAVNIAGLMDIPANVDHTITLKGLNDATKSRYWNAIQAAIVGKVVVNVAKDKQVAPPPTPELAPPKKVDDFTKIEGIDEITAKRLLANGILTYADWMVAADKGNLSRIEGLKGKKGVEAITEKIAALLAPAPAPAVLEEPVAAGSVESLFNALNKE